MRRTDLRFYLILLCAFFPTVAAAHVKWFYPYDLSEAPKNMGEVLTPGFAGLYVLSIVCIYIFFYIDRLWFRKKFLNDRLGKLIVSQDVAGWIIRGATAFLFIMLFFYGLQDNALLLTPELNTELPFVKWMQLAIVLALLWWVTTPIAGLGILVLYAISIQHYGLYHLIDYMFFFGLAVFLILLPLQNERWTRVRYVTLFASTGLTIGWGAIEKFAYPQWTYPLLQDQPFLLMGMEPGFYMTLAGFVEFNLAFILLSSASVASRMLALVLNTIFMLAIYMFGLIDAVGHAIIIAVLIVLAVRGPTSARYFLVLQSKTLWTEAYFMTGLYVLMLNFLFLAYYGFYYFLVG
ncbi:hypothetical protein [Pseudophaeobacter sp.]|uniref:hypothetical protein n=1 Tax=Pseudophaeobacter sp. TaxID=1971739 RepID=UPI003299BAE7